MSVDRGSGNTLEFLCGMVSRLQEAGINCIVFGGWASEFTGLIAARPHTDIDLLYLGDEFGKLDAFIYSQRDLEEIHAKHFPHKRAFMCRGVMTEIILVSRKRDRLITSFWNDFEFEWPDISTIRINIQGHQLFVSIPQVVEYYHKHEKEIDRVRARHVPAAGVQARA